jgi:hypothetical protein
MASHHHAEILLALVRRRWDEARELVGRHEVDPEPFVAQCTECDIHPWVDHLLRGEELTELVGARTIELLGELRQKVRYDNMLLLARAEQALDLLAGAGVTPIVLKGLDLLHRLYERIDLRTIDDVDLLVREDQLGAALAVLEQNGWETPPEPQKTHYIRSSHHLPMRGPGPIHVEFELHWNIAQEERYRIDSDGLIERAVPLEIAGRTVSRLEDHDLVAHILVHHLSHYFDRRLKWLVDLQHIVEQPGFSWERVVHKVRQWGAVAASAISLVHMKKLMPDLIPARVIEMLPVAGWRNALTWPLRSAHPLELFRNTSRRQVQLYLAAVMLEKPAMLPSWMWHRRTRDSRPGANPLDKEIQ